MVSDRSLGELLNRYARPIGQREDGVGALSGGDPQHALVQRKHNHRSDQRNLAGGVAEHQQTSRVRHRDVLLLRVRLGSRERLGDKVALGANMEIHVRGVIHPARRRRLGRVYHPGAVNSRDNLRATLPNRRKIGRQRRQPATHLPRLALVLEVAHLGLNLLERAQRVPVGAGGRAAIALLLRCRRRTKIDGRKLLDRPRQRGIRTTGDELPDGGTVVNPQNVHHRV